jgi:hypothetical protein
LPKHCQLGAKPENWYAPTKARMNRNTYIRADLSDTLVRSEISKAVAAQERPLKKRKTTYTASGCPAKTFGGFRYNHGMGDQSKKASTPMN